jgi:hypothetical protein
MLERLQNLVLIVLVFALVLRVAWELLQPMLPFLVVLLGLTGIFGLLFRRHR